MTSLALAVCLQVALANPAEAQYADAYYKSKADGRPLVVLIGAPWCPGCRVMKSTVIPQATQAGLLKDVHYAYLNSDEDPVLAHKLMSGGTIPQLLIFYQTPEGWQRRQLTGAQNLAQIEPFVQSGVTASLAFRKAGNATKVARKDAP